jgi:hypothetical protein
MTKVLERFVKGALGAAIASAGGRGIAGEVRGGVRPMHFQKSSVDRVSKRRDFIFCILFSRSLLPP